MIIKIVLSLMIMYDIILLVDPLVTFWSLLTIPHILLCFVTILAIGRVPFKLMHFMPTIFVVTHALTVTMTVTIRANAHCNQIAALEIESPEVAELLVSAAR